VIAGQPFEFLIDERDQLIERSLVPIAPRLKQLTYLLLRKRLHLTSRFGLSEERADHITFQRSLLSEVISQKSQSRDGILMRFSPSQLEQQQRYPQH
jgi:hypothetical protein